MHHARPYADIIAGRDARWRQLHADTEKGLRGLVDQASRVQQYEVALPNGNDHATVLADSTDLLTHLRAGRSLGFWLFRAEVVKRNDYLIHGARVNGRPAATVEVVEQLIDYVQTLISIRQAWAVWRGIAQRASGPLVHQARELGENQGSLSAVLAIHDALKNAQDQLNAYLLEHPRWVDSDAVELLIDRLESVELLEDLRTRQSELDAFATAIAGQAADSRRHPVARQLAWAAAAFDPQGYAAAVVLMEQVQSDAAAVRARNAFLAEARSQLKGLVADVMAAPEREDWDDRLSSLPSAWNWARASAWLDEFDRSHQVSEIEAAHRRDSSQIAVTLAELAAEQAWRHCFLRMTEEQRQHLVSWGKVVKKIGKASKYAFQRRKEAQAHMDKCRDAVPAWIMPFHRVAETIPPSPELFDVVIVDEASQSGLETLLLAYLAKQIIIVGDDKQIAPEYVGVDQGDVDHLISAPSVGF